jgi:nucleotide-binding universal stress UspA family protein
MYDTVLVATDGSEAAAGAVDAALALAERFDATLHAVHVSADDTDAGSGLVGIEDRAEQGGVAARTAVLPSDGSVSQPIVEYAEEHGVDLAVVGTHGRTGLDRFILGSVAERVLRTAPMPVLAVRTDTSLGGIDDLLVPTDGSDCAKAAVGHAIDLATATGATLHLVHVVDVTVAWPTGSGGGVLDAMEAGGQAALDRAIDRAEGAGVAAVEATLLSGSPYRAIADYAADQAVDCTVMGTHGRTGFNRYLLGSVAERVVRVSPSPVLAVKAAAPEEAEAGTWAAVGEEGATDGGRPSGGSESAERGA